MDSSAQQRAALSPSNSDEFILHMDPEASVKQKDRHDTPEIESKSFVTDHTEPDVCYSLSELHSVDTGPGPTVNIDAVHSFLHSVDSDSVKSNHLHEQKMTAKLDDLLDNEKKVPPGRRLSLYDENPLDLAKAQASTERYTLYSTDLGSIKSRSLQELLTTTLPESSKGKAPRMMSELLIHESGWWIDILSPTDQEMRAISKMFRIHPLTTEDIQAQESREKCELFQNYVFISFRSFNHDFYSPNYLEAVNFYIVLFKDGVLTFRFAPLPHPHNVRKRINQLKEFIRVTPEWINYALIDDITDSFAPLIQHTELEVDSIDDLVLVLSGSEKSDMLRRIGSCRKTVMQLMRLLGPKADVIRSLIKRYDDKVKEIGTPVLFKQDGDENKDGKKIHNEVTLYLGDIQDHILTMMQNVNHYDLVLGRAHRNYIGQISIELSQAGNTTNEVINRLTFLATIVVPLNLVAGLFGMNVHVPGQDNSDLAWFFWIVFGMLMYVACMVAIGKRSGFL